MSRFSEAIELITTDDVASLMDATPDAVRKRRQRGALPFDEWRQDARVWYDRREVECWLADPENATLTPAEWQAKWRKAKGARA